MKNLSPEEVAKRQRTNKKVLKYFGFGLLSIVVFLLGFSAIMERCSPEYREMQAKNKIEADSLAKVEAANKLIEAEQKKDEQLLTTAYLMSKKLLKASLKDPDSYDEQNREYHFVTKDKKGIEIEVLIDYTANNSFGGKARSTLIFHYTRDLLLIDQFEK